MAWTDPPQVAHWFGGADTTVEPESVATDIRDRDDLHPGRRAHGRRELRARDGRLGVVPRPLVALVATA